MAVMDNSDAAYLNLVLDMVPFFNIFREDMEESINRLAQDLEKCCREIPDVEVIHTGSGFEGLSLPHLDKNQTWNTDADHMIIRTSLKLLEGVKQEEKNVEESVKVEQEWPGESKREEGSSMAAKMVVASEDVLYIYDASHAGYVHLSNKRLVIPIDSDSVREHCLQNSNFIEKNRDLIRVSHNVIMSPETGSIAGPSYSMRSDGGSFNVSRDFVYGLKCERWPVQAKEWIHRDRPQSWPSSELISTISTQGCHIVPVGSHSSNLQEFEWRFSFSVAEMILAGSLTDNQKLAYSVLKALIKSEMKLRDIDLFASYHLKTCLFWFLEKKGVKSWDEQSLGTNVLELLDFITAFYAKGSVPNYFIAKNNMIDHRSTEEILNACHALKDIRASVTQSLCRYIETNQALPVLFDTSLTQQLKENPTKFLQNCKYNFLVMALAYILKKMKKEERYNSNHGHESACSLVIKARILHNATPEENSKECSKSLSALSEVSHLVENPTANMVLSLLEENLAADQMKVTETSAVALAVFNVFLTLHPSHLDPGFEHNSLELHEYLINPTIKECLFWAARVHERYCDAIYNFVVKKWVNGPQFFTTDEEATKFMKLVMIILGKPTKQASAVTGSLAKRSIEGNRFLLMRFLADYLLHVHLESAYIAFQAAAYLMNKTVLSEIYLTIKWSGYERSKLRAIELVLSKQELQAELSEEEFTRLLEVQHDLMTELNVA